MYVVSCVYFVNTLVHLKTQVDHHTMPDTKIIPIGQIILKFILYPLLFLFKDYSIEKDACTQNWCKYSTLPKLLPTSRAEYKFLSRTEKNFELNFTTFEAQQSKPLFSAQVNCTSVRYLTHLIIILT